MNDWRNSFIELFIPCSYRPCPGSIVVERTPERGSWTSPTRQTRSRCSLCGRVGSNEITCGKGIRIYESARDAGEDHKGAERMMRKDLEVAPNTEEGKPDEGSPVVIIEKESSRFERMDPKCPNCGAYDIAEDGICNGCEKTFTNL